ncbi:hypothetical protein niasHT_009397 [Heterodera trifolii]|uniref:Peptidase M41 domain-containing protein n=1 Tax=Heterodera trifolii TaxID=157864 RepID=A0ABD2M1M4_9BILA
MAPGTCVLLVEHVELLSADKLCQEIDNAKESQHFIFIGGTSTENHRALQVFANIDESWFRKIEIQMPLERRRRRLFGHFTSGFIGLTDVELNELTRRTIGFSANQILATVNRAREHAIFEKVPLLFFHFHTANLVVELVSEFKPFWRVPVATERWTVDILIAAFGPKNIGPRKSLSEIQVLGGHVLEALVNGEDNVSTIYEFDLAHANKLARKAVDEWGMTDLGLVYVDDVRKISDKLKNDIETEVKAIIDNCTMIAHGLTNALHFITILNNEEFLEWERVAEFINRPAASEQQAQEAENEQQQMQSVTEEKI